MKTKFQPFLILLLFMVISPWANAKDIFFKGNQNNFIKVNMDKKYISLQACTVVNLKKKENQINCQKLFTTTKKDFKNMRYCLNSKYGLNLINYGASAFLAFAAVALVETGPGAVGTAALSVGLAHEATDAFSTVNGKKKIFSSNAETGIDYVVNDMPFDEFVLVAKKSITDNILNCDVDPVESTDSTLVPVTLNKFEINALKISLTYKKPNDCEICQ